MKRYYWLAIDSDQVGLIQAVGNSAQELADILGITKNCVGSTEHRGFKGGTAKRRIIKVEQEEEEEVSKWSPSRGAKLKGRKKDKPINKEKVLIELRKGIYKDMTGKEAINRLMYLCGGEEKEIESIYKKWRYYYIKE